MEQCEMSYGHEVVRLQEETVSVDIYEQLELNKSHNAAKNEFQIKKWFLNEDEPFLVHFSINRDGHLQPTSHF